MEARGDRETCAEVVKEEEEEDGDDNIGCVGDDEDALKRRISAHPLYGKLVKIHLDCLQVGVVDEAAGNRDHLPRSTQQQMDYNKSPQRMLHQSDLDQFMEAYCVALSKLREAMEEPQQESMAFISNMHSQLQDMSAIPVAHSNAPARAPAPAPPLPPPTSSGH